MAAARTAPTRTITDASPRGVAFIQAHEGNPLTAYLDPAGVPTIGTGATNRSRVATAFLKALGVPGGKIVPGKTKITAEQSAKMFAAMLDGEYEPAVIAKMPRNTKQHQFDAMLSATYNLGARFMGWKWLDLWLKKGASAAASHWSTHYNTAGGKKLPGLVRRRKEEAILFLHGIYTGIAEPEGKPRTTTEAPPKSPDPVVKEAQKILTERGFNPGAIDGWFGEKTRAALILYQKAHPHLVADGILGPATLAQLRRDAMAARDALKKGGGALAGSGILSFMAGLSWQAVAVCAGIATVAALAYVAWRYRDVLQRRWNTLRGKTVEV